MHIWSNRHSTIYAIHNTQYARRIRTFFAFFLKKVWISLNIPAKFGIITIATEMAVDGGLVAHEKPGRARQISLICVGS